MGTGPTPCVCIVSSSKGCGLMGDIGSDKVGVLAVDGGGEWVYICGMGIVSSSKNVYVWDGIGLSNGKTSSSKVTCREIITFPVSRSRHRYPQKFDG